MCREKEKRRDFEGRLPYYILALLLEDLFPYQSISLKTWKNGSSSGARWKLRGNLAQPSTL